MQLTQRQINYCMECGVCTGSCPISRHLESFSPRQIIKKTLVETNGNIYQCPEIWSCLTCARCSNRCPVLIDFPEFIRSLRNQALKVNNLPHESHHGVFQTIAQIQTKNFKQNRTDWAQEIGTIREQGEYFYFVGCIPYFEKVFRYLDLDSLEPAKNTLKLLNKLGIDPVVSDAEKCCGHDALWTGDENTFRKLASSNIEAIKASGAQKVIFSCPEGYITFKEHYPKYFGELPFEVLHITELLAYELPKAKLEFKATQETVTYHDPCRLGRLAGIYEQPRDLLRLVPNIELKEMQRNRENALCCGTSAWIECSACSKAMQTERLQEAIDIGAHNIITSCPKCQIHLTCAKSGTDIDLKITDLLTYLTNHLKK